MLRRVRHKLRMIRYYSAPRSQTAWSRALDVSLIVSFFLALPAAWMCDQLATRSETVLTLNGRLSCGPHGAYYAWLDDANRNRNKNQLISVCGNFQLHVEQHRRGWPLATTTARHPAVVDVDIITEAKPRKNVHLAADDPLRIAIEEGLREGHGVEAVEDWQRASPQIARRGWAWLAAFGAWWIILAFASSSVIHLARFATFLVTRQRRRRQLLFAAEGRCAHCGYDLTGNEFAERCPECGQLVS